MNILATYLELLADFRDHLFAVLLFLLKALFLGLEQLLVSPFSIFKVLGRAIQAKLLIDYHLDLLDDVERGLGFSSKRFR